MKVYIVVKEDCSAYGTMGGDHCYFHIEGVFFEEAKARNHQTRLRNIAKKEREDLDAEWGIKYRVVTKEVKDSNRLSLVEL